MSVILSSDLAVLRQEINVTIHAILSHLPRVCIVWWLFTRAKKQNSTPVGINANYDHLVESRLERKKLVLELEANLKESHRNHNDDNIEDDYDTMISIDD